MMIDAPLPLEQTDPVLAEHFRLIANGLHPAVKTVVAEGRNTHIRKNDGKWIHRKVTIQKIGRNEPCPCGSGLKYKRCCEVR